MNLPGEPLNNSDLAKLAASGISRATAELSLFRRVASLEGGALVGKNGGHDWSGLAIPYVWPGESHVRDYRLRLDHPKLEQQSDGTLREKNKYVSPPGRGNLLYIPPGVDPALLDDASLPLFLTEGEKQCLALWELSQHRLEQTARPRWLSMAVQGVWNWRGTIGKESGPNGDRRDVQGPIPDLSRIEWRKRHAVIVYDTNVTVNPMVAAARRGLAKELTGRGANVEVVDLPHVDGVNGVDDLGGKWGPDRVLELLQSTAKPWEPIYGRNDAGNGDRLADAHGPDLIYCEESKNVMVWNDTRWIFDPFIKAEKLAEKTLLAAFAEASKIEDADKRKAFLRFLNQSLDRSGITNMVHSVKRKVRAASINQFDDQPWLLNCRNGTIDLRSGLLREHRRDDLLTKCLPIDYSALADCPIFKKFIGEILPESLIQYIQKLFGCAATGIPEKVLAILDGPGDNGKTTLIEIIRAALGEDQYAGKIEIDTLLTKQRDNAANTDIADLKGRRFVSSSEPNRGRKLSLGLVKDLTGMGEVRGRRLKEDFFNFKPTHKLFLDCNHKPEITDPNDAIWNRVKLIPFTITIEEDKKDPGLLEKLKTELPGILTWIVDGAVRYFKDGIGSPPEQVQAATKAYRKESDTLREFIEEKCIIGDHKDYYIPIKSLYPAYCDWIEATGETDKLKKSEFDAQLKTLGPEKGQDPTGNVRVWKGIRFQ